MRVGVAAAAVQVAGLLRWPLVVPFVDDPVTFHRLNVVLGESAGYALTALWTVLVARRMGALPRAWGFAAAAAIASGLLVPLHVPGAAAANFAGYVLWSLWLIGLGAARLRAATSLRRRAA